MTNPLSVWKRGMPLLKGSSTEALIIPQYLPPVRFCLRKKISLLLEAIEEVSRSKEFVLEEEYLKLSERYILSSDPSCKREASRIVGNLAAAFPENLDHAITALLQNANHDGTVIRWASAYALSRIVIIPRYARGPLFEEISDLYEKEKENGVKNQYAKALKTAGKIR